TAYTYRILAYNGEGDSEYSNEAVATTFSSDFITTSYSVTADTYVRGGTYANDNFGAEEELRVKTGSKENYFRNTLVKFDLSQEDLQHENVMRAVLRLYAKRVEDCDVIASEIDNTWTELDVTWSSAPASGDEIASAAITTEDVYYEWDITSLVHTKLQQDKIVSVCLKDHQGSNANLRFNSKEAVNNHPELVLSLPNQSSSFISFNENLLKVYPNPANNVLNVTLPNGRIGDISIYSLTGKLVHEEKNLVGENKIRIDHLDNSIYLLKAKGKFGTINVKFVKAL
ncbi:MAG TPA: DNRLRE domain-containing protein, partial [Bacteroidales bacterium]|nr:DNRLRE domain-containing protein [Bacteroidales bacterium]